MSTGLNGWNLGIGKDACNSPLYIWWQLRHTLQHGGELGETEDRQPQVAPRKKTKINDNDVHGRFLKKTWTRKGPRNTKSQITDDESGYTDPAATILRTNSKMMYYPGIQFKFWTFESLIASDEDL
jgi:hypothetical protein